MLNKPFETGNFSNDESSVLFLEIGDSYCMASGINATTRAIDAVQVFTFEPIDIEESIQQILQSVSADNKFKKTVIAAAFTEALLIPRKLFFSNTPLVNIVYDVKQAQQLHDQIAEWQMVNLYAIPTAVYKQITERFPAAMFMHVYTPLLKIYNGFTSDMQLMIHFMNNQFRLVAKKEGQIHLVQTYHYTSPMDVAYYLLKIATEFSLPVEETQLVISGFVDENSALYKELRQYFAQIHFANLTELTILEEQHPNHFFTSIHNLAACVL